MEIIIKFKPKITIKSLISSWKNCTWALALLKKAKKYFCATMKRTVECVVVGDSMVGKLCLAHTYTRNEFPEDQIPLEHFSTNVEVNGREINLSIFKHPGQEEYDYRRAHNYAFSDVILICFNIADRTSFENVRSKWIHEVRQHCTETPLILVGCKADLRKGGTNQYGRDNSKPVTYRAGAKLAKELKMQKYVECSAKFRVGIKRVFEEAISHVLDPYRLRSRQNEDEEEGKLCTFSCLDSSAPFYKSSALTFDQLLDGTKQERNIIKLIRCKFEDGTLQLHDMQVR